MLTWLSIDYGEFVPHPKGAMDDEPNPLQYRAMIEGYLSEHFYPISVGIFRGKNAYGFTSEIVAESAYKYLRSSYPTTDKTIAILSDDLGKSVRDIEPFRSKLLDSMIPLDEIELDIPSRFQKQAVPEMSNTKGTLKVIFDESLTATQIQSVLEVLADHFRACGGLGFEIDFEFHSLGDRMPAYV